LQQPAAVSTAEWYHVISNSVNKKRDKKMAFKLVLELLTIIALSPKKVTIRFKFPTI